MIPISGSSSIFVPQLGLSCDSCVDAEINLIKPTWQKVKIHSCTQQVPSTVCFINEESLKRIELPVWKKKEDTFEHR